MISEISVSNEVDGVSLDEFVSTQPEALVYSSSEYRGLLRELIGADDCYISAARSTRPIDVLLPGLMSRNRGGAPVLNSLPFYGSCGGIVGPFDEGSWKALVSRFYELARERSCVSATIVTSPFDRPEKAAWYCENLDYDAIDERLCQVTSLCFDADHSERLMTSFHQKTRNMVRKAEKVGVTVQVENEMLEFVSEVHSENMLAIGGIAKSKKFFSLVPKYFKANEGYRIYVARIAGEPVAAVLLFYFNRTVEYFTPVVRAGFRDTQALSGAIFRAMCDASRAGYHRWNWGGTWATQEGVYLFKRRWGAMDFPYRYFVKIYDRSLLRRRRDEILAEYPNFYVVPFGLLEQ